MQYLRIRIHTLGFFAWMAALATPAAAGEIDAAIATIRAVGPNAAGHRAAAPAWRQLAQAEARQLPVILAGMDDAGPLAANWLRTAADAVAERALQRGEKLPAAQLEQFVRDLRHAPRARRLAYELLVGIDPATAQRLLPAMLNDPSLELRRDAVARFVAETAQGAKAASNEQTIAAYRQALTAARDLDQIKLLSERLHKLGQEVDLPRHFGFITQWKVIGPFDNSAEKGFDVVYPPERQFDPQASYDGKLGKVAWTEFAAKGDFAVVNLNAALGEAKAVVGYAAADFFAKEGQKVCFRLTAPTAVKLWVNGVVVDQHNVYHQGSQLDQYISRATLQSGRNVILVKVCQNEQTQDWAKIWQFQLRVCDENGGAILSADGEQ